jgi:cytidylate kinase
MSVVGAHECDFPGSPTYDPLVPTLYLVSGIPGAGKTSVSRALAQRLGPRAVHLEGDVLSFDFVVRGLADPSDVEEWERQMKLRRTNLALLAQSFADADFNVVIDDVVVAKTALASYATLDPNPRLIILAPSLRAVRHRDANRAKQVFEMWSHLDAQLRSDLAHDGTWIDSSDLTVDETVDAILGKNRA